MRTSCLIKIPWENRDSESLQTDYMGKSFQKRIHPPLLSLPHAHTSSTSQTSIAFVFSPPRSKESFPDIKEILIWKRKYLNITVVLQDNNERGWKENRERFILECLRFVKGLNLKAYTHCTQNMLYIIKIQNNCLSFCRHLKQTLKSCCISITGDGRSVWNDNIPLIGK